MSLVRLYDSVKQFVAKSGVPMSGGKVKVFIHNTDDLASLYADAAGTTPLSNPMSIDTDGRTLGVFVADGSLYRIEVYGVSGNLEWTVDNVTGGSGGGGGSSTQLQADWTDNDPTSVQHILHRPGQKEVVAGTGITITENSSGIVLSCTVSNHTLGLITV